MTSRASQNLESKLQGKIKELVQIPVYRRNLILMLLVWSIYVLGTYLIPFYFTRLNGNFLLYQIYVGVAMILAAIVAAIVTRCGAKLKPQFIVYAVLSTASTLLLAIYCNSDS